MNISCLSSMFLRVRVVFRKTVVRDWCFDCSSGSQSSETSDESSSRMLAGLSFNLNSMRTALKDRLHSAPMFGAIPLGFIRSALII